MDNEKQPITAKQYLESHSFIIGGGEILIQYYQAERSIDMQHNESIQGCINDLENVLIIARKTLPTNPNPKEAKDILQGFELAIERIKNHLK